MLLKLIVGINLCLRDRPYSILRTAEIPLVQRNLTYFPSSKPLLGNFPLGLSCLHVFPTVEISETEILESQLDTSLVTDNLAESFLVQSFSHLCDFPHGPSVR